MRVLRRGAQGDEVKLLQERLVGAGAGPIVIDGVFGEMTESAVRLFQGANALEQDGIVGPATWGVLLQAHLPEGLGVTAHQAHLAGVRARQHELLAVLHDRSRPGMPGVDASSAVATRAVEIAIGDLGKREVGATNQSAAISHLTAGWGPIRWGLPDTGYAWCVMAVSVWTGIALGLGTRGDNIDWQKHPFGVWQGNTAELEEWARATGRLVATKTPQPGLLFTLPRHTGMVVGLDENERYMHTIEGNVSNKVGSHLRRVSTAATFIRWWP